MKKKYFLFTLIFITGQIALGQNPNSKNAHLGASVSNLKLTRESLLTACSPSTASADLDINNVRAQIMNGGDMWWDIFGTQSSKYEIPKGSGKNSLFTGSLWIGGYDAGGQLKQAAMTYRQTGIDFWSGPLTTSATTDNATCLSYDKLWKINKADVVAYNNWQINGAVGTNPVSLSVMDIINTWPAYSPDGRPLAPYTDVNIDGNYNPADGDYPGFDLNSGSLCGNKLYGDQAIWWVFNDVGNIHTETGGASIGIEIQAQAYAYATTGELNNATFYKYKIINKSSFRLDSTYFGQFADPDLGTYSDDYVGCDVSRGLGYCYNGTATDAIYGANPPVVGFDFLEGPFADPDGIDNAANTSPNGTNYGDGIIDNERLGMSKFVYYNNNSNVVNGNPLPSDDFYQYLTGTWKNGAPITYGASGTTGTLKCSYMFPGGSDPVGWGVGGTNASPIPQAAWSESNAGIAPGDRRFLQSAGPFTLLPGAVNTITTGVIWAQATSGGSAASMQAMLNADDAIQSLFSNCFSSVGINDSEEKKMETKVYPNPFVEQTTLFFENPDKENYEFYLYDLTGKIVKWHKNITGNELVIFKNDLAVGTYIFELRTTKNQFSSGKIIIR